MNLYAREIRVSDSGRRTLAEELRLQIADDRWYAYVGAKTSVLRYEQDQELHSVWGLLGGFGFDIIPSHFRLEGNGGFFDRGTIPRILTQRLPVQTFGASIQVSIFDRLPPTLSADTQLYRNDLWSAARYLTFAVAHLAPKERPETLTRYRAALRELEAQVGRVQVNVSEEAAEIRIDGNLVGLSPLSSTVFVTPGEHTIEARGQGSTASNRIEVSRGSFAVVELALAKPAPAPTAPTSVALAAPTPKANPETSAEPARSRSSRASVPSWACSMTSTAWCTSPRSPKTAWTRSRTC